MKITPAPPFALANGDTRLTQKPAAPLGRRMFVGLSLSAIGGVVFGCGSSADTGGAAPAPAGAAGAGGSPAVVPSEVPFGVWEKLRAAVRASPDHLVATSDRLVAAKDAKGLFEFVRDQIATYPPNGHDGAVTDMRWGVRGTLRGGAGTPREKAELLAALYGRAGFQASVVSAQTKDEDPSVTPAERAFLRTIARTFAPAVDDATLAHWAAEMAQTGTPQPIVHIDADDAERSALVASLIAVLPPNSSASLGAYDATVYTASLGGVPLVAVVVDGVTRFANPLFAESTFGASMTAYDPMPAPPAGAVPEVTVELFVSTTAAPEKRVSVVKGTYAADQLAGRQLLVQLAPAMDAKALANLRIRDVHTFKPVLSLRGHDVQLDTDPSFVVVGAELTTRGDVVKTADDGAVTVNGRKVIAPGQVDPNAAKTVASVTASARAGGFPTVKLIVSALDASGTPVKGLPASAFRVAETASALGFVETALPGSGVRVLLIFDLDDPLASGEDPFDLAKQLTSAVIAAYPGAVILTGAEGKYVEQTDPAAVVAALDVVPNSDLDSCWFPLADAATEAPTLVVMVSDFNSLVDPNDPQHPQMSYRNRIAAGPPLVAVGNDPVTAPPRPEVDKLVALTGGVHLPHASIKDAVDAVLAQLAQQHAGGGYELAYGAPIEGPAKRTVTVTVNGLSASASYPIPAGADAAQPAALAGIYLKVTIGDESVTRVLGGYLDEKAPPEGTVLPQTTLDDVRSALFGVTLLSFEAAAPTPSMALDDLLTTKLAMKPLWEALVAKDSAAIRAAIPTLRTYVPAALTLLQCPLPPSDKTSATYEMGLRVVAYTNRPRFGVGQERRLDILPLSGWGSVSKDPVVSFRDTLARTARVAVVEGHSFPTSTLSRLAGSSLTLLPGGSVDPLTLPYGPEASARASDVLSEYDNEYFRVLPAGNTFLGFWAVHKSTGALLGVLPNGTGGASSSATCDQLKDTNKAFDALGLLAELGGMGALGPFFFLGKEVAAIALLSAAIIGGEDGMVPGNPNAAIDGLAANAACEAAKLAGSTANGLGGLLGDVLNKADAIGSVAGSPLVDCPNALAGVGCK